MSYVELTSEILDYIEDNLKEKLSVDDLAGDEDRGICNLSAILNVAVAYRPKESFEELLEHVSVQLESLKAEGREIGSAIIMEVLGALEYQNAKEILAGAREAAVASGASSPMLSNLGVIPELRFGSVEVADCYILTPNIHAPGFMLGLSSYRDVLTLAVSHSEAERSISFVENLLSDVVHRLVTGLSVENSRR